MSKKKPKNRSFDKTSPGRDKTFLNQLLKIKWSHIIVITILCLTVYSNTLKNDFVYDDISFIVENLSIRSLKNIPQFFTSKETFSSKGDVIVFKIVS